MLVQVPQWLTDQFNIIHQKVGDTFLVIAALVIFSAIFVLLAGSTVGESTVQYDEFTDIVIAFRLSQHPLSGHTYDGSQSCFPMYATAAVYRIIQMLNPSFELLDILPTSRWLSIMMTVLAIWGTYLLGAKLFNASVGLFASALFTFSPYVLHFGHVTLTQGDTFTAAPVIFSLITFVEFTKKRTTFWLFAFSSCLALAIATKFFLLIFIPA